MTDSFEKGKNTVIEMLTDREYKNIKVEGNTIIVKNPDNCEDNLIVFFSEEIKLNINHIKDFNKMIKENKYSKAILVYPSTITPSAKNLLKTNKEIEIELFELLELQYNRTRHRLVPKHIKITSPDEIASLKKYIKTIAYILEDDAISRYYNYKKGDIIKIIRHNGSVYYRLVV